jgi:hypothetical protein
MHSPRRRSSIITFNVALLMGQHEMLLAEIERVGASIDTLRRQPWYRRLLSGAYWKIGLLKQELALLHQKAESLSRLINTRNHAPNHV